MTDDSRWHCLIEPPRLIEHFISHPPLGFQSWWSPAGTPMFSTRFDPLAASGTIVRRLANALTWWRPGGMGLRLDTCFVGTAVSEYAPLSCRMSPLACVDDLLEGALCDEVRRPTLIVVKDLPCDSPLVDDTSNTYADAVSGGLRKAGFVLLSGQALAWVPIDFTSIDGYLAGFSKGRRKDIRRKLRSRAGLRVSVECTGAATFSDPELRARIYRLYLNVYERARVRFECLSPAFLDAVLQDAAVHGRVFLYQHGERLIGFNLCFIANGCLTDKYVGFQYPDAREHNLYCVSWIENIEYARAAGLSRYVAGVSDPEFKAALGAQFTMTRHAVYAPNRWLRVALRQLSSGFERDREWIERHRHAPART